MTTHWDNIIGPLLRLLQPKMIVEIGADAGDTTRRLLDLPNKPCVVTIDPAPRFDAGDLIREYGESKFVLIQRPSLEVASLLWYAMDVVLIDGDHNWYTVYNELKMIHNRCTQMEQPFPIVFLHDISWPYGRRDLYYDPERIPAEFRHPYARSGVVFGRSELHPCGFNAHLVHADHEGGLRNGVLTAIEDFQKETEGFRFIYLPGYHGLGLLFSWRYPDYSGDVSHFINSLTLPPYLWDYFDRLESSRICEWFYRRS